MVYVHATSTGISLKRAKLISHPFDYFFGFDAEQILADSREKSMEEFQPVVEAVKQEICKAPSISEEDPLS